MKFNIKDISPEGRQVSRQYDAGEVRRMLIQSELQPLDRPCELMVELFMIKSGDAIHVQGTASGSFWLACGRCLGPSEVTFDDAKVRMTFLPPPTEVEQELELDLDDLDTAAHDGVEVDLEPLLREQLVLAIPIKPVCSEQCKGICPTCGADLNRSDCGCQEEPAEESPWKRAIMKLQEETGGKN